MKTVRHLLRHLFFGDCSRRGCGHSIAYHVPVMGCMKCDCEEYK